MKDDASFSLGLDLDDIARTSRFRHYVALMFPEADQTTFSDLVIATNWPAGALATYARSDQFFFCSLLEQCRKTTIPVASSSTTLTLPGILNEEMRKIGGEVCCLSMHDAIGVRYLIIYSGEGNSANALEGTYLRSLAAINMFRARKIGLENRIERTLSKREIECLRWSAAGKNSDDISVILGLSACTVNAYIKSAVAKMNACNRVQAVAKACRLRLI